MSHEFEEFSQDAGRDLSEILLSEDHLVLHDEDLGGLSQGPSVVQVGESEHLHHIAHGEVLDGRILDLRFEMDQIVQLRESQKTGEICLQDLLPAGFFLKILSIFTKIQTKIKKNLAFLKTFP